MLLDVGRDLRTGSGCVGQKVGAAGGCSGCTGRSLETACVYVERGIELQVSLWDEFKRCKWV